MIHRARLCSAMLAVSALIGAGHGISAVTPPQPGTAAGGAAMKPFGLQKRVPWTTSRVVGSPDPPLPYRPRRVFSKLNIVFPMAVYHEPGTDSLLIVHQLYAWGGPGRILRVKDDPETDKFEVLLSLDRTVFGLAFHPDYKKNGFLFIGANGPVKSKAKTTRVSRYTVSRTPAHACDPKSEKVIIEWSSDGHNGGDLAFGNDGMLYIGSGDGTSDSDTDLAGQDLTRLRSKVLRIDVDRPEPGKAYSVPADNPFVNVKGARPETWAYGFRQPWRLHVDPKTGDLWVGNNGQDLWEQVYLVRRGANYGWSVMEGGHPFYLDRKRGPTPISKPIIDHPHSEMRSLTGGVVYPGKELPELRGAYLYSDWSTGRIWGVRHKAGEVTWHRELARTTLQVAGIGLDSRGELLVVDHGGGLNRLEPTPKEEKTTPFPTKLSETGLFTSVKGHVPQPGLIPYSVNAPLWSDGADKERFIALPGAGQIDFAPSRGWNCPDGTVLVKTFSIETPASRRRIETRLLTRQLGQWAGYSYLWNDAQTDAELVGAAGRDQVYEVRDPKAPGGKRKQTWRYPSRIECMVCHSRAANFVLGLSDLQMNKVHDYGKVSDNQLRTLAHIGVLRGYPAKRSSPDRQLVDPYDVRQPLEARARSYLHVNCSQCHVEAGGGNAQINLELAARRERTPFIGARPLHDTFGVAGAEIVRPGEPERSTLYLRMSRRGPGQMPPLATSLVDHEAVRLLHDWIKGMKPAGATGGK